MKTIGSTTQEQVPKGSTLAGGSNKPLSRPKCGRSRLWIVGIIIVVIITILILIGLGVGLGVGLGTMAAYRGGNMADHSNTSTE
ncbi:hypothetical protein TWF696_004444 [Orbilia brochopaga]|uniref:Uncharacterized protein n=1 Tax=Orbilia brochopaga TaxID=3140254 RepID=A0AAV9V6U0_9PEZI